MPASQITIDDVLRELRKTAGAVLAGFTSRDMAESMAAKVNAKVGPWYLSKARGVIRDGIASGKIEFCGYRKAPDISGRTASIPTYRMKRKQK